MKNVKRINIRNSNTLYKKALKIIPYGSQTYSKGVKAFSDGVSALNRTTKDIINDYITKELNSLDLFKYHNNQEPEDETQWLNIALKLDYIMINISNYNLPTTKEQYYYRHLFEKHYTGTSNVIPYFWMPKYVNATDSSARTLAIYNETNSTD